jgi:hypothetical protein
LQFWLEDDGCNGVCEELSVTVRGSSFEDAKTKMEAALQAERVSRAESQVESTVDRVRVVLGALQTQPLTPTLSMVSIWACEAASSSASFGAREPLNKHRVRANA